MKKTSKSVQRRVAVQQKNVPCDASIIQEIMGHWGRLLSGSKTGYSAGHPKNTVFFNANVYVDKGLELAEKIWYGDIDLSLENKRIFELADRLGKIVYVTREMPYRFEEPVTVERLHAEATRGSGAGVVEYIPGKGDAR